MENCLGPVHISSTRLQRGKYGLKQKLPEFLFLDYIVWNKNQYKIIQLALKNGDINGKFQ
jgi:hypothetical protein